MAIYIDNLKDGEEIQYSLPLLIGTTANCPQEAEITIENKTEQSNPVSWPVIGTRFKALIHLQPGRNKLLVCCGKCQLTFNLIYSPILNSKYIRLVYIKCEDDDGNFQAPEKENNSMESACKRISLAAQMIQTFTAENLQKHSLGRKTFNLEEDKMGNPICHVFTSRLKLEEAFKLCEDDLWSHFAYELMTSHLCDGDQCKFLAFLSFTRYCNPTNDVPHNFADILKLMKGHVALGGGGLALFGTACIHTWAQSIEEVPWRFTDSRHIDRRNFMDDSGNRHFHWACYSTGLGATLHELGHTFDLGHTKNGIMGRGFDDIYKVFTLDSSKGSIEKLSQDFEKCSASNKVTQVDFVTSLNWTVGVKDCSHVICEEGNDNYSNASVPKESDFTKGREMWNLPHPPVHQTLPNSNSSETGGAYFERSSAVLLCFHRWLNPTDVDAKKNTLSVNGYTLSSNAGIRVIEFRNVDNMAIHHVEFLDNCGEKEVMLNSPDLLRCLPQGMEKINLVAEDSCGNILKSQIFL